MAAEGWGEQRRGVGFGVRGIQERKLQKTEDEV